MTRPWYPPQGSTPQPSNPWNNGGWQDDYNPGVSANPNWMWGFNGQTDPGWVAWRPEEMADPTRYYGELEGTYGETPEQRAENQARAWAQQMAHMTNRIFMPYGSRNDVGQMMDILGGYNNSFQQYADGSERVDQMGGYGSNPYQEESLLNSQARFQAIRNALQQTMAEDFGNVNDNDINPDAPTSMEKVYEWLENMTGIGEKYGTTEPGRNRSRWQEQDMMNDVNRQMSNIGSLGLGEEVSTWLQQMGMSMFAPSRRTAAPSPRAFTMGGYGSQPNTASRSNRGAYSNAGYF